MARISSAWHRDVGEVEAALRRQRGWAAAAAVAAVAAAAKQRPARHGAGVDVHDRHSVGCRRAKEGLRSPPAANREWAGRWARPLLQHDLPPQSSRMQTLASTACARKDAANAPWLPLFASHKRTARSSCKMPSPSRDQGAGCQRPSSSLPCRRWQRQPACWAAAAPMPAMHSALCPFTIR